MVGEPFLWAQLFQRYAVGRQNKKKQDPAFFLSELFYLHRSTLHAKDHPTMALASRVLQQIFVNKQKINYKKNVNLSENVDVRL